MRTAFLGTSAFAAQVLEHLARSQHRPALVVTRPDRPRGRGRQVAAPPVADAARALDLPLAQPTAINGHEGQALLAAAAPEVVVLCAFGALIREPVLSAYPMLNVHPSLLPRWRGAAPIERAIAAGDERTGVAIMRPVAELDAGPVCLVREEPIAPDDDFGTLSTRLADLAGELLVEAIDERPPFVAQSHEGVTFAEKIGPEDRRLDHELPAAVLERRVRALHPHVGTFVEAGPEGRLGVEQARLAEPFPQLAGLAPGVLADHAGRLMLRCADAPLELLEVKPAGGRAMAAADYLRGRSGALADLRGAA